MQILDDIRNSATELEDLQTDIAKEIYSTCTEIRQRMVKIITAKSNLGKDVDSIPSYLQCFDFVDQKLTDFKEKFIQLKNRNNEIIPQQNNEESK